MNHVHYLTNLGARGKAIKFATRFNSLQEAWDNCDRGDWTLWLLGKTCKKNSLQHKKVVLLACQCARLALRYVPKNEERPRIAIETAEAWARDEVSIEDVKNAAAAAYDAAYDTTVAYNATAAAHAAYAAAHAAYAAYSAAAYTCTAYANNAADSAKAVRDAYIAHADADAYTTDVDDIGVAYVDAAKYRTLKTCAEISRREVSNIDDWLSRS